MMILKNGKFYKDNVEVPIEIGNQEQIALIKKFEKVVGDGVELRVHINEITHYDLSAFWKCPFCAKTNGVEYSFEDDEPNDYDIESALEDKNFRCYTCSSRYELKVEKIDKQTTYKLIIPNSSQD